MGRGARGSGTVQTLRRRLAAALLGAAALAPGVRAQQPPNLLLFLSDDQRDDFLGCAGHPFLRTPHLDRLAAHGVRFANAFVTTPICAASRASLFTGLWERRHGYTFGRPPLPAELVERSYPALLKQSGYRTGFVGKFGVRVPDGAQGRMFDFFRGLTYPYFRPQPDGSRRHLTDLMGDAAREFLQGCRADQPFCLSVSFQAAHAVDGDLDDHYPSAPAEDGLYEDVTIPPPRVSTDFWQTLPGFLQDSMHRDRWAWRWDTPEKYQRNARAYYRLITGLDRVIGEVLAELEGLGLAGNTVVVFLSDNGYYKGSRGFAGKWSHFEEALRVPLVVYDPRLPAARRGRVREELVLNTDLASTLVDLAGVEVPDSWQGMSLRGLIQGDPADSWRRGFFAEHGMEHPRIPRWVGVRDQRYVYARYLDHGPEGEFLHDLETDPLELTNLAGDPAHADVLQALREQCDRLGADLQ